MCPEKATDEAHAPGVDRLEPPTRGLVHYIAYGPVWARAADQRDILGFGPVASSLTGPLLEDCDRWFGAYASPAGGGTGSSVCRLVDGDLALIAVRGEVGGDPRLDSRGYLLIGDVKDLTVELALRLWPSTPSRRGTAPLRTEPSTRVLPAMPVMLDGGGPGAHSSLGAKIPGRPDGGAPQETAFVAVFEALVRTPGDARGRGRDEPITVEALDGLAVPARRIAERGAGVDRAALARMVAAALRYGSAADREKGLRIIRGDAADGQGLLWCLFGLLAHPSLRPVAGEPTFVQSRDWPLPGAAGRPVPRFVYSASTSRRPDPDPSSVRLDEVWSPDLTVFTRAGQLLAEEYLDGLAAAQPDVESDPPGPGSAGAADRDPFGARLARLGPIDPSSPRSIATWCRGLLGLPEPEQRVAELEARVAELQDELARREPDLLAAAAARDESAARLAAAGQMIRQIQTDLDAATQRAAAADQASAWARAEAQRQTMSHERERARLRDEITSRDTELARRAAQAGGLAKRAAELETQAAGLRAEIGGLKAGAEVRVAEVAAFRTEVDGLKAEAEALRTEVGELKAEAEALGAEAEPLRAEAEARAVEVAALKADLAALKARSLDRDERKPDDAPAGLAQQGEREPASRRTDLAWVLLIVAVIELLVIAILTT
jgi:uncharacterized coiled-coil DUF342 family protein